MSIDFEYQVNVVNIDGSWIFDDPLHFQSTFLGSHSAWTKVCQENANCSQK